MRHGLDGLGQGFFCVLLQVDVQGQGHGTAGLRLLGIELAGDLALLIGGDDAGALGAVEIGFKGLFRALAAYQGVHGVTLHIPVAGNAILWIAHPVLVVNRTQTAQNVGGIFGVVHPGRGGAGGHAPVLAVRRLADELHGHIVGKDILGIRQTLDGQLVAYPGDGPGLVLGIAAVDIEQLPQLGHKPVRLQSRRHLGERGIGNVLVFQKQGKALAVGRFRIAVGSGSAHRQRIVPGGAVLRAQVRQPQDGGIELLIRVKFLCGKDQRIGQPVGHQHLSVAVGDNAPGRFHRFTGGIAGQ